MNFSDVNTKTTSWCLNVKVTKYNGIKNIKTTIVNSPLKISIDIFTKLNIEIVNITKNLNIKCSVINTDLKISLIPLYAKLVVNTFCAGMRPKISYNVVCGANRAPYLYVEPDIIWLTPDMISEEFDIYSNVNWTIDVAPNEDDKDIVSMLFNELMIGNNTLFLNGDAPLQILEMLHNGQMFTNETLLVDTSVIVIKELESSTRILNKYYLKN